MLLTVDELVGISLLLIPIRNAEGGDPSIGIELRLTKGLPLAALLDLQFDDLAVLGTHRSCESAHLHHEALVAARIAERIHRPEDGPEALLGADGEGSAAERPFAESVA